MKIKCLNKDRHAYEGLLVDGRVLNFTQIITLAKRVQTNYPFFVTIMHLKHACIQLHGESEVAHNRLE